MMFIKGVFWPPFLFFTDSDSSWWADSGYIPYILLLYYITYILLLYFGLVFIKMSNFGSKADNWAKFRFLVSYLGKSTSLIMKMIMVFTEIFHSASIAILKGLIHFQISNSWYFIENFSVFYIFRLRYCKICINFFY